MANFLGMDVDEVERVGHDLVNNQVSALNNVLHTIAGHVNNLPGIWHGSDSSTFIHEWETTHKGALTNLIAAINQLGHNALTQAGNQRDVSRS